MLNVGLSAGVLNTRVFSMFVVHALVLTFMTTPLTVWIYPPQHRVHTGVDGARGDHPEAGTGRRSTSDDERKTKFSLVLEKLEQLPSAMMLTQLLQGSPIPSAAPSTVVSAADEKGSPNLDEKKASTESLNSPSPAAASSAHGRAPVTIDTLRLIELTERTSAVFKSQESDFLLHTDPVVAVFRTFAHLHRVATSAVLSVVPREAFADSISTHARAHATHMVVLPWAIDPEESSASGSITPVPHAFAGVLDKCAAHSAYAHSVRTTFAQAPTDVALFVDRGAPAALNAGTHIFLPFFGGPDDRLALSFVVQLCSSTGVSATVVRITKSGDGNASDADSIHHAKVQASAHNVSVSSVPP